MMRGETFFFGPVRGAMATGLRRAIVGPIVGRIVGLSSLWSKGQEIRDT
ncbi:MAG: hypothetical protein OJF50_004714 [Nitrospira sp.]|jgi:hypothetical protein|nr:hypothetical protein [Nitrospira sp.]